MDNHNWCARKRTREKCDCRIGGGEGPLAAIALLGSVGGGAPPMLRLLDIRGPYWQRSHRRRQPQNNGVTSRTSKLLQQPELHQRRIRLEQLSGVSQILECGGLASGPLQRR